MARSVDIILQTFCTKLKLEKVDVLISLLCGCALQQSLSMVRHYKKKAGSRPYRAFNADKMEEAVAKVRGGQMSIRRACAVYGVPRSSLHNRVKGRHTLKVGHQTVFSEAEERSLVRHIQCVSDWGYPFSTLDMRFVAKNVLDAADRHVKCFKNNLPSAEWARSFLARHSRELTMRTCQNIKKVRAGITPEEVSKYFDNLSVSLKNEDGSNIPPEHIFNYDETNLTDDPGVKRCVFRRGVKYPERIRDSTKASISLMFCGSAAGEVLPPYVVYKADHLWNRWTEGGLKNVRYNRSKSGWFDAVTFGDWFESAFIPHARRIGDRVVLIGDNLASHFSERVIQAAKDNNVAFVCLPKNSTHLCQPLDVAFFRALKIQWRGILDGWKEKCSRKCSTITKEKFPSLLRQLCLSVCGDNEDKLYSENLVSGFRKCGIAPFNPKEVLSRLPQQEPSAVDENDANASSVAVSDAVLKHLKSMRYGDHDDQPARRKRSRISVQPGCSIAYEELDAAEKGPKSLVKSSSKKQSRQRQSKAQSRQEVSVEPSDDEDRSSAESTGSNDSMDDGDKGQKSRVKSCSKKQTFRRQSKAQRKRELSMESSDDEDRYSAASSDENVEEPQPCCSSGATGKASALPVKCFYKQTASKTASAPVPVPASQNSGRQLKRNVRVPSRYK